MNLNQKASVEKEGNQTPSTTDGKTQAVSGPKQVRPVSESAGSSKKN